MQDEARLGRERACDAQPALVAVGERAGGSVGVGPEPERARAARRRAGAPHAAPRRRRAPRPRRSPAPRGRGTSGCAGTSASPARPRRCGLQRVMSRPSSSTAALVGEVEAREDVHERRLARAVRADQADDLVAMQLERDVSERLDAFERARDAGGPERSSGPPCLVSSRRSTARQIFGTTFALIGPTTSGTLFCIRITRYCRPNTVWSSSRTSPGRRASARS